MSGTVASLVVSDGDGARNHGGQTDERTTRTCMKFDQSVPWKCDKKKQLVHISICLYCTVKVSQQSLKKYIIFKRRP